MQKLLSSLIVTMALSCVLADVVEAADSITRMLSATFKITNPKSTATAFLIERESKDGDPELILVTAAHVFESMSGDGCKIVLRRQSDDGSYERQMTPIDIREKGDKLWVQHPKADVAAMRIQLPPGNEATPLPYDSILDTEDSDDRAIELGDEVYVFAFPNQLESSPSGFPVLRRGIVASFPLTITDKRKTFMVDYSTFAGDSGGPVFIRKQNSDGKSEPIVVGLIHGQHRETMKSKTPNEERIVHRPMGLAIVTHAKLIRETVDLVP